MAIPVQATVFLRLPLHDPRCGQPELVGTEIARLRHLSDVVEVPTTVAFSALLGVWRDLAETGDGLAELTTTIYGPVSIRGWLCGPGMAEQQVQPVFNNLSSDTARDTAVEILGALRRRNVADRHRLVLCVQRFVAPDATVQVRLVPSDNRLELRACWGMAELLDEPLQYDQLRLDIDDLTMRERWITDKPTATMATLGGAQTTELPPEWRCAPVLDDDTARRIGAVCLAALGRVQDCTELEFVLTGSQLLALRCPSR